MTGQPKGAPDATRVMVLSTDAGIGGVERASRSLIRALVDLLGPDRVGLLSVWASTTPPPCWVLFTGGAGGGGRVGLGLRLRFVLQALHHAFAWRTGLIIVACHPHLGAAAWLAHAVSRAPYAVWCHGEESWGRLRPTLRFSLGHARVVFAPSRFTAERVELVAGLSPNSVCVLPHCLTPELMVLNHGLPSTVPHRVLTVARLVPDHRYKGVDTLIRAWPEVLEAVPDAQLIVIGAGADSDHLERLSKQLRVQRLVRFLGAIDDGELARQYRHAAIFALPSRTRLYPKPEGEGFGLVYLEAAASGCAVVAAQGGAVPEVVIAGETGLLVDLDRHGELSQALIRLLLDSQLAERLGENGRHHVSTNYGYPLFRARVERLLERISQTSPVASKSPFGRRSAG
jgi:glycosyltransferase involved in cell wall biosynthesis